MTIDLNDYARTAAQRGWGEGWPSCSGAKAAGTTVVTADKSGTRISVHKRLSRLVDLLIDETERRGYLLKSGQCGGYNCRAISGTRSPSNHSWALALDLNWQSNPYCQPRSTDMPAWMPLLWNRYGFAWGGNYNANGSRGKADSMHFEFMGSPSDADAMTALAIHELTGQPTPVAPVPDPRDDEEDEMAAVVLNLPAGTSQRQLVGVPPFQPGTARIYMWTGWTNATVRAGYFVRDRGPGLTPAQEQWGGTGSFVLVQNDRPWWQLPDGCTGVGLEYDSGHPISVTVVYKPA